MDLDQELKVMNDLLQILKPLDSDTQAYALAAAILIQRLVSVDVARRVIHSLSHPAEWGDCHAK